jgi:glucose uptake protein
MFQPSVYWVALLFMVGSMFCWGSWANMMKLTPRWPFQLFYWDYVLGLVLMTAVWGVTLGNFGATGMSFFGDLAHAGGRNYLFALLGGVIFNAANILLVSAIEIAGMAVAFPVGIGLALIVGVVLSYVLQPQGNLLLLALGVLLVMGAIVVVAMAYARRECTQQRTSVRGIRISIAAGILMGLFYPPVSHSMTGEHGFGPYAVSFVFAIGVTISTVPFNLLLMRRPIVSGPPVAISGYTSAPLRWHVFACLGGAIWATGAVLNFVASHTALVGPAVSYAIGQGATMVSAAWGVFVWHEFATAPRSARRLLPAMFGLFAIGLVLIATAPLFVGGR